MRRKIAVVIVVAGITVGAAVTPAPARRVRTAIRCRAMIGTSVEELVRSSCRILDDCVESRGARASCARLEGQTEYSHAVNRAEGISKFWCSKEFPILANYGSGSTSDVSIIGAVAPNAAQILEDSTQSVLGGVTGASSRARRRCIRAIAHARSSVALGVLGEAIGCQEAVDRRASEFGKLAAACIGDASGEAARASKRIARACRGSTGAAVGSCDPLPACVIANARAAGHELAKVAYGVKAVCGNEKVESGESCDEGAANSATGACTDECQEATCGDGKVEAGVEDCDNGKKQGQNFETETCTANCKQVVCGNDILQLGEQCDDGNLNAGDGCSPTCRYEPFPCGVDGSLDVTVTFVPERDTFSSNRIQGVKFGIGYPSDFSVAGSEFIDAADPASPLKLLTADPNEINLLDGSATFFDADASPPFKISTLLNLNRSANLILSRVVPIESIHFGCAAGTPVTEADFPCTIDSMVDLIARSLSPDQFPKCVVSLPRGGSQ